MQSLVLPTVICYSVLSLVAYCFISAKTNPPTRYAALEQRLEQMSGEHLVFVRYPENHNVHLEMVYNKANIDQAKIVWANELSSAENDELVEHFGGRQVWIWDVGDREHPLVQYQTNPQTPTATVNASPLDHPNTTQNGNIPTSM